MATAELAVSLPVLMLLVLTAVYAVQVAGTRVRCLDAAREVARAAARGDPAAARVGHEVLPGASLSIRRTNTLVTVVVTTHVHPLDSGLPAVAVTERAIAPVEPGAGDAP